jgi:hypothetical protein
MRSCNLKIFPQVQTHRHKKWESFSYEVKKNVGNELTNGEVTVSEDDRDNGGTRGNNEGMAVSPGKAALLGSRFIE